MKSLHITIISHLHLLAEMLRKGEQGKGTRRLLKFLFQSTYMMM